ncbi:MAG: hypothetical protein ACP5HM_02560 [Anaerolineae bacterium]
MNDKDKKQRRAKIQKLRHSLKRIRKEKSAEEISRRRNFSTWLSRLKSRLGWKGADEE